jgi:hypothetical protein
MNPSSEASTAMISLRFLCRLCHLVTFAFLYGQIAYETFMNKEWKKDLWNRDTFYHSDIVLPILLVVSGLGMMFLLLTEFQYYNDRMTAVWKTGNIIKLILAIFMTPLLDLMVCGQGICWDRGFKMTNVIKFIIGSIIVLLSLLMKFHRDYSMRSVNKGSKISLF